MDLRKSVQEEWKKWLDSKAPFGFTFGQHPDFERNYKECQNRVHTVIGEGKFAEMVFGEEISLSRLLDSRHPDIFLIPRNRYLSVVDDLGEPIDFDEIVLFPFSSTNFYTDPEKEGVFREIYQSRVFLRLWAIGQLGHLVPPRPDGWDKNIPISYSRPPFHHTRWHHSLLTAILMELVLASNAFSKKERTPLVLTAACHDIATPAGGDSVKCVDPGNLSEEKNFSWVLKHHDLVERWKKQFGFCLEPAEGWVRGKGIMGRLLDILDKISYVGIDCYWLGLQHPGKVRDFCTQHPLVMDLWQDIRFTSDQSNFGFSDPEKLFQFLLMRAYEHQELLFNPYSRAADVFIKKTIRPLYEKGVVTKKQLLTLGSDWLLQVLNKHYPQRKFWIEPEEISWKKLPTFKKQQEFCCQTGDRIEHTEQIAGFSTGLDWPVLSQKKKTVTPLRKVISRKEISLLEDILASVRGYYVFFRS